MADTLSKSARSARMSLVKSKDTSPELVVRRLIHSMGFRYSLHGRDLPGRPDIILRRLKKAIFVHGCFWHRHRSTRCKLARLPKSRLAFWLPKLEANRLRDDRNSRRLKATGWKIMVVWECQLSNIEHIKNKLVLFLEGCNAGS